MDDYNILDVFTGPVGKRTLRRARERGDGRTERFIEDHIETLDPRPIIDYNIPQEEQIIRDEPTFNGSVGLNREDQTYSMSLENYFLLISPTRAQVSIGGKPVLVYDQERETPNNETYWQDTNLRIGQEDTVRSMLVLGVSDLINETLVPIIKTQVEGIIEKYENSSEEKRIDFHIDWDIPLPFDNERVDGKSLQEIAESYDFRGIVEEKVHSKYKNEQGFWKLFQAMDSKYYDFMPMIHELRFKLGLIPNDPEDKDIVVRFATKYQKEQPIAVEQASN